MARAKYKQLDRDARMKMEALFRAGLSRREIATQMGCHISTVYREFRRGEYEHLNTDYTTERRYSADKAEAARILAATAKGAPLKIGKNFALANWIEKKIKEKYSPVAICALLRRDENAHFGMTLCRATIYKYIDDGNIFLGITNRDLPERGRRKREYKKVQAKRLPRGRSIEERPADVKQRIEVGHWEMDTVVSGKKGKARLLVLSERATRKEIIVKIPDGKAISVIRALDKLERKMGANFSRVFRSITCDNGSEFADHEDIERSARQKGTMRTTLYYCHPYTASERGTNENINRMIRRHFPKGTNFDLVTPGQVKQVETWINTYPRAVLGYASAQDIFDSAFCTI